MLKEEIEKYTSLKGITIDEDLTGVYAGYKFYIDGQYNVHLGETIENANRGKLIDIITPADYGKKINYSANGVDDWKVFYNDGVNVYIIASDYLDISSITTPIDFIKMQMINNNDYMVCWNQNIETNIEASGTLTNTDNWTAFATGKGGESATGGPTYEMLADSWKQNPKTNSVILDPYTWKDGLTDSTGLYILNTNNENGCNAYWLASSTNVQANALYIMGYGNAIYYNDLYQTYNGIRPLVCLKSETIGTVEETISIDEVQETTKTNARLVSTITPTDYGKKINYSANGVENWRVFYNDGEHVYIIASNYINMDKVPVDLSKIKMAREKGKYQLYWTINNNVEAIQTLTNVDNWSAFANGKGGESATGGPTYEMLANSWNQNPKTNSIKIISTQNYQEGLIDKTGLYIPHTTLVDGGWGYRLASCVPETSGYTNCIFHVYYPGAVYMYEMSLTTGIRPVVCLNGQTTGKVGSTVVID